MSGMYPCHDTRDTLQMLHALLLPQAATRLEQFQDNACKVQHTSQANILRDVTVVVTPSFMQEVISEY
jgi:hypothetical protein